MSAKRSIPWWRIPMRYPISSFPVDAMTRDKILLNITVDHVKCPWSLLKGQVPAPLHRQSYTPREVIRIREVIQDPQIFESMVTGALRFCTASLMMDQLINVKQNWQELQNNVSGEISRDLGDTVQVVLAKNTFRIFPVNFTMRPKN